MQSAYNAGIDELKAYTCFATLNRIIFVITRNKKKGTWKLKFHKAGPGGLADVKRKFGKGKKKVHTQCFA